MRLGNKILFRICLCRRMWLNILNLTEGRLNTLARGLDRLLEVVAPGTSEEEVVDGSSCMPNLNASFVVVLDILYTNVTIGLMSRLRVCLNSPCKLSVISSRSLLISYVLLLHVALKRGLWKLLVCRLIWPLRLVRCLPIMSLPLYGFLIRVLLTM